MKRDRRLWPSQPMQPKDFSQLKISTFQRHHGHAVRGTDRVPVQKDLFIRYFCRGYDDFPQTETKILWNRWKICRSKDRQTRVFRFFSEPVRCFLKSVWTSILKKGGQTTEQNISRAKKKNFRKPLEKELKEYRDQGISLYLDGEPSSPRSIAKACQLAEGGGYMRDYIEDEKGRIARVSFDFIEERTQK